MKRLLILSVAITSILFIFISKAAEDTGLRVYVTVDGDSEMTRAMIHRLVEKK